MRDLDRRSVVNNTLNKRCSTLWRLILSVVLKERERGVKRCRDKSPLDESDINAVSLKLFVREKPRVEGDRCGDARYRVPLEKLVSLVEGLRAVASVDDDLAETKSFRTSIFSYGLYSYLRWP